MRYRVLFHNRDDVSSTIRKLVFFDKGTGVYSISANSYVSGCRLLKCDFICADRPCIVLDYIPDSFDLMVLPSGLVFDIKHIV